MYWKAAGVGVILGLLLAVAILPGCAYKRDCSTAEWLRDASGKCR